jgi:ribonuclease HI
MSRIRLYTDGACSGNPGPGGWGALLISGTTRKEIHGGEPATTNNRMELTAVIKALEALKRPAHIDLYTDSKYVRDGITGWIGKWKQNGWKTSARKPVKNVDLWTKLDELSSKHQIAWHWVKGHSGHPENDRADALANLGLAESLSK